MVRRMMMIYNHRWMQSNLLWNNKWLMSVILACLFSCPVLALKFHNNLLICFKNFSKLSRLWLCIGVMQDHLVCYFGGALALASRNGFPSQYMDIGKRLTDTCWQMYRQMPTGLSPEIVYFNTVPHARDDLFVKVRVTRVINSRSTQPFIPPGSLNWVPASAGVKVGNSPLPGGR